MTLANGRSYLAIPGPSVVPDRVLTAMHKGAPNIYEGPLIDETHETLDFLKQMAGTKAHTAIYISNGHGAWEAANSNLFSRGDKALVIATGLFGHGWSTAASRLGVEIEMLDFGKSCRADAGRIEAALRADRGHRIKAVLVTHVDTASSVRNDLVEVRAAIDAAGHPALLAVDAIASFGCDRIEMDNMSIDVLVAASQKGVMVPAGLGFIWASDKARARCRASDLRTPYWDWDGRFDATVFWQLFAGTPPTHHLFALHEALTMILREEGLEHVWARHAKLAAAVWAAVEAWGNGGDIALNVVSPTERAHSVTALRIGAGGAGALRRWLEEKAGVTLGIPLGMAEPGEPAYGDFLRIGHMGHVNAHMIMGVLATMEAGMQALGIPHGRGALEDAAAVIAGA